MPQRNREKAEFNDALELVLVQKQDKRTEAQAKRRRIQQVPPLRSPSRQSAHHGRPAAPESRARIVCADSVCRVPQVALGGFVGTPGTEGYRRLRGEELLYHSHEYDARPSSVRTSKWTRDALCRQLKLRNELEVISNHPDLLAAYERHGVWDHCDADSCPASFLRGTVWLKLPLGNKKGDKLSRGGVVAVVAKALAAEKEYGYPRAGRRAALAAAAQPAAEQIRRGLQQLDDSDSSEEENPFEDENPFERDPYDN